MRRLSELWKKLKIFFLNHVNRPPLRFQVKFGHIMPEYPEAEKLHAAKEENNAYHRCPSIRRIVVKQLSYGEYYNGNTRK